MTTIVLKPSFGRGASNNRPLKQHTEYERKITHREKCREEADRLAFRSLERSLERKRVLAERIRQRLSQVPSARRVRQSVQCPFMALHSDKNGCGSNLFIHYNEAKAMGMSVREHERGVPFLFYNWNRYVNRNNPEEIISAQPISDWTNRTGNITRACITGKCAPSST